jgi:hypothetical protein
MTGTLTFYDALHEYRIDGRIVPSVTEIIEAVLQPDYSYADEWHKERGGAVHKAAELIGLGKHLAPVCDAIAGYVEAVRKWYAEHPEVVVLGVEMRVHTRSYAGTLDLLASDAKGPFVLDWKCGPHITTCWQLGGYANAIKAMNGTQIKRGRGVTLNDDGTYKETEDYDMRRYATEFQWIMGVHGIKKGMK